MSIIRVKKNKDYFAVSNQPFNDDHLSWEARGVMGYLLSKPDDWSVRFNDLVRSGPAGDHKVRRILKELEDAGYLVRERFQKPDGTFDWQSTIYEKSTISRLSTYGSSTDGSPICGSSTDGKPRDITSTDLPSTELISTEYKEEEEGRPNIFVLYEQNFGHLTAMMSDILQDAEKEYPDDWIREAFKIAVSNNARKWSYVEVILRDWTVNGYKNDKKRNDKKSKPKSYAERRLEELTYGK